MQFKTSSSFSTNNDIEICKVKNINSSYVNEQNDLEIRESYKPKDLYTLTGVNGKFMVADRSVVLPVQDLHISNLDYSYAKRFGKDVTDYMVYDDLNVYFMADFEGNTKGLFHIYTYDYHNRFITDGFLHSLTEAGLRVSFIAECISLPKVNEDEISVFTINTDKSIKSILINETLKIDNFDTLKRIEPFAKVISKRAEECSVLLDFIIIEVLSTLLLVKGKDIFEEKTKFSSIIELLAEFMKSYESYPYLYRSNSFETASKLFSKYRDDKEITDLVYKLRLMKF